MIEINPDRYKFASWAHQLKAVPLLIRNPYYALWWEMRLGKTKAIIDTACTLFDNDALDVCCIVCPAQVKDVWLDKEFGEIQKHCWIPELRLPINYDSKYEEYLELKADCGKAFIVTSFEFLRQENAQTKLPKAQRLRELLASRRSWVVIDEAAAIANFDSLQAKACREVTGNTALDPKWVVDRITLLDGTPVGNNQIDLFSKLWTLKPSILGYKNWFHFRAVHCAMTKQEVWVTDKKTGKPKLQQFMKVDGFQNEEKITNKAKAFSWRLEQKDCLDMPEKLPPTFFTVPLSPKTWKIYCQMRDEMVADLESGSLTVQHAPVKSLRLAQICAGFLGGFVNELTEEVETRELSTETTKAALQWVQDRLHERPDFKCVIYCRWRPEIVRLIELLRKFDVPISFKYGGKTEGIERFHPDSGYTGPGILVANAQATRFGINFSRADSILYLSSDYDRVTRSQSEDRVQASKEQLRSIGIERQHISITEVLVTGPQGEKTITWDIYRTLRSKENIAQRTVQHWKHILEEI
jgi:SNF2-related domain